MKQSNNIITIAKRVVMKITEPVRQSLNNAYFADDDGGAEYRRRIQYTNITANIISTVCGGVFLTGLLLYILRDEPQAVQNSYIGMIVILQQIANVLQFLTPVFTAKMISRRKYIVFCRTTNFLINIVVLALIPILPISEKAQAVLFLISIFIMTATGAVYSPAICLWHIIHLPENGGKRSDWMAMSQLILPICNAVASLLASFVVDYFELKGMYISGILIIRGLLLLVVYWDLKQHGKIPEPVYKAENKLPSLKKIFISPFKYKEFMLVVLAYCLYQGSGICGQYWNSYLIDDLNISYTFLNACTVMQIPMYLVFIPLWSKFVKKNGWLTAFGISALIYLPPFLTNCLIFENTAYIIYPLGLLYCYITVPGINLAASNLAYIQMPEENQTECMSFYNVAANISAVLFSSLGKAFISATEGITIPIGSHEIVNKQYLNLLAFAFIAISGIASLLIAKRHKKMGISK